MKKHDKSMTSRAAAAAVAAMAAVLLLATGCMAMPSNHSIREGVGNIAFQKVTGGDTKTTSREVTSTSEKSDSKKSGGALPKKEERGPAIIEAVQNGDYDTLEQLLSDVDDVRPLVPEGTLLLHMAEEGAAGGGMANPVTELLVEKKAWILQRDSQGRGAHYVLYDYELFGTPRGDTPLYYLVKSASKDFNGYLGDSAGLVRVLLEAGSDPNAPCSHWDGTSMLYTAASNRMDDVVELLLEFGAVVDDQAVRAPNASDRAKALMARYKK